MVSQNVKSFLYYYWLYISVCSTILAILAVVNRHIGLSTVYVRILLCVFNWGREKVEIKKGQKYESETEDNDEELEEAPPKKSSSSNNVWDKLQNRNSNSTGEKDLVIVLNDCVDWLKYGMESIVMDDVTDRFNAAELASWNLLTRTNRQYMFISWRLSMVWFLGFLFRYIFLVPVRIMLLLGGVLLLLLGSLFAAILPVSKLVKRRIGSAISSAALRIVSRFCQLNVTFYGRENLAKPGGICVANHTSPFDVVMLAGDNNYAFVGQQESGPGGYIQSIIAMNQDHIWFDRAEKKDRELVTKRLKAHVSDLSKNPILIFPEGVCSNNTSVMMFRKGSFEATDLIYPVAIKYDNRFCDAYFGQDSVVSHAWSLLTSWCIRCEVIYLRPLRRRRDEGAIEFAQRAKRQIAFAGRFTDCGWDGSMIYRGVKTEMIDKSKDLYSKRLIDMIGDDSGSDLAQTAPPEEVGGATDLTANET